MSTNYFNALKKQNDALSETIDGLKSSYSSDNQKVYYLHNQAETAKYMGWLLFFIYYIVLFWVVFAIFYGKRNQSVNFYWKIFFLVLFVAYPFYIFYLEYHLYEAFQYTMSLITANAYVPSKNWYRFSPPPSKNNI